MPIYDYLCSSCGERTEVIHGIDAPGPRFCPACGAEDTLRKAFAPPTVHFKGSGWAKKDRSSSRTKVAAQSDSGTDANAKASGSGEPSTASTANESTSKSGGGDSSGAGAASSESAGS